jgi:hypothetical protein
MNWVQDYQRIGEEPTILGIDDAAQFRAALDEAYQHADIHRVEKDESDIVNKATDPGKFKWPEWEPAFVNYLSTIPGVNGTELCYVIWEIELPDRSADFANFNERAIACTPLTGSNFQANSRKVHQLLKSYLQAGSAKQWIKPLARHQDGRKDMKALRGHYSGEGNTSRRIAVDERYRETLHNKNEKALSFSVFLDKIQPMITFLKRKENQLQSRQK